MTSWVGPRPYVAVARDGRHLAITRGSIPEVRSSLLSAGVRPRARIHEGSLIVDLRDAPALFGADLDLEWDEHARRLAENRARVWSSAVGMRTRVTEVLAGGAVAARATIADSPLEDRLDDHQAINVAALTLPNSWGGCLLDEQGTGKSVTLIATFDLLVERGEVDTMIVAAPKSMVAEWQREFELFTGDMYRVTVADGSRSRKARALCSGADVVVVNYETLVALEDEVVRLARRTRLVLTIDESFNVKNRESSRTAAALRVREWCCRAYVLCGTPAPNAPADIVSQFDLVDFGYTFAGVQLDKDRDVAHAQVRKRLDERGVFVRNLKSRVLPDLPVRTFTEVEVQLAPQQRAAYDAALGDLIVDLRNVDDAGYSRQIQTFLERRSALLRICADPSPLIPGYDELPAKVEALDELLKQLVVDRGEKVIVWSFYRSSLDRIADRFADYGLVRVDGSVVEVGQRREAVRRFQEDEAVRIFVGNPAAAGAGLTLHAARYAIYESLSNQAAHWLQSLDRIHRRGQDRDVRYITLLARGTLEETEYGRLRTKADAQADLLGDPLDRPPTRRMMLGELLASAGMAELS